MIKVLEDFAYTGGWCVNGKSGQTFQPGGWERVHDIVTPNTYIVTKEDQSNTNPPAGKGRFNIRYSITSTSASGLQ